MKINLGSGPVSAKGWTNYDWGLLPFLGKYKLVSLLVKCRIIDKAYDWKWPSLELVDIRKRLPDEDDSVDYVYCSNVLEHFERYEAKNILKECRRILKKNAYIRIVLPDLKKLIKNYSSADNFNREYFGYDKDLYSSFISKIKSFFIRGHQWMYDDISFRILLKEAGFKKIYKCKYRYGKVPDLKKLDIELHKKLCFYYECKK